MKRIALALACLIFVAALLLRFLIHHKSGEVQAALQSLLDSKTHGAYEIEITDYDYSISPLSLQFEGLVIKNKVDTASGVRSVIIPKVTLSVGSIQEYLNTKVLHIKNLTVVQPMVELAQKKKQKREGASFTQGIVKLYPAIESVLSHFNVQHLEVQSGGIAMESQGDLVRLNLIDLLIDNWNLQQLSADRQFRIAFGKQSIHFQKGDFTFERFEYNFRKRELRFSNFKYDGYDSITQNRINAGGEYILLKKLDYEELFHHQKLKYDQVVVEKPTVQARIRLKQKEKQHKEPIEEILKNTFGELQLDSAVVHLATIRLNLVTEKDSTQLDLPSASLQIKNLLVSERNDLFDIGSFRVNFDKTRFRMRNDSELTFQQLEILSRRIIRLENVNFYAPHQKGIPVATLKKLEVIKPDLLQFLLTNEFKAESITLSNGRIDLNTAWLNQKNKSGNSRSLPPINIENLALSNIHLNYQNDEQHIQLKGLSAVLQHLALDTSKSLNYQLNKIAFRQARLESKKDSLKADIDGLLLKENKISISQLWAQYHDLKVDLKNLSLIHAQSLSNAAQINWQQWSALIVDQVNVKGSLPLLNRNHPREKKNWAIGLLKLNKANIDLLKGDTLMQAIAKTIEATELHLKDGDGIQFEKLHGDLEKVSLKSSSLSLSAPSITVRLPEALSLSQLSIHLKDQSLLLQDIKSTGFAKLKDGIGFNSLDIQESKVILPQLFDLSWKALHVENLELKKEPHIEKLLIHQPELTLANPSSKQKKSGSNINPLKWIDQIEITDGKFHLPKNELLTIKKIKADLEKKSFGVTQLELNNEKTTLALTQLAVNNSQFVIDSLKLLPKEKWYMSLGTEQSILKATITKIAITPFAVDSILSKRKINNADVAIGNLGLWVSRDKRLPDPKPLEKPGTLAELLKLPDFLSIRKVTLQAGDIHVKEVSEKTGLEGNVSLTNLKAVMDVEQVNDKKNVTLVAETELYKQGKINLNYVTKSDDSFQLNARVSNLDLMPLNNIVLPLESVEIKSGFLESFNLEAQANREHATGFANITYRNLHLQIHKRGDPNSSNLASNFLTFIADGIILRHSKKNAKANFEQPRIKHKSVFNYWVKSGINGAMKTVKNGK